MFSVFILVLQSYVKENLNENVALDVVPMFSHFILVPWYFAVYHLLTHPNVEHLFKYGANSESKSSVCCCC